MCSRSSLWLIALATGLLLTSPMACHGDRSECRPVAETCDGMDNDCDGVVDNGFDVGAACSVGIGACRADGVEVCASSGVGTTCNAAAGQPSAEQCNGVDDDCDGLADEEVAGCCASGDSRPCGVDQGACHQGTQACSPGRAWGACLDSSQQPVVLSGTVTESCNGVDDDCDGQTDEADASGCTSHYADHDGDEYGTGPAQCLCAPVVPYTAQQDGDCDDGDSSVHPGAAETCDGMDQDCDGETDEGVPGCCAAQATQSCGADQGVCQTGTQTCGDDRAWGSCLDFSQQPVVFPGEREEACNGVDDDCDGVTDDGFDVGYTCVAGVGACQRSGQKVCASLTATACDALPGVPAVETCDGIDDDCDGQTDEGLPGCCAIGTTRACGVSQGVCIAGTETCTAQRAWGSCLDSQAQPVVLPGDQAEVCEGIDNDCDGQTDEDFSLILRTGATVTGAGKVCGVGRCSGGVTTCKADGTGIVCSTEANATNEVCNNLDDDCNGSTDETGSGGYMTYDQPLCENQNGVCAGARKTANLCVSGSWLACGTAAYQANSASYQAGSEASCDGKDNDCDGSIDEGLKTAYYRDADTDGYGSSSMGTQACSQPNGYVLSSMDCDDTRSTVHPGAVELCNGIDDDCDGSTDEGFQVGYACDGTDADLCQTGTFTCKADGTGAECVNESQPNKVEFCANSIDDDCDGVTDEAGCVPP
jgi:hypothetical protein